MKHGFFFSPFPVLSVEIEDMNLHGIVNLREVAIRTVTVTIGWLLWRWSFTFDWKHEPFDDEAVTR